MKLEELITIIKNRPNMFFLEKDVESLWNFLNGFLLSRSFQDDFSEIERRFQHEFSSFVADKMSMDSGEGWNKLLRKKNESWQSFFEYYHEFSRT